MLPSCSRQLFSCLCFLLFLTGCEGVPGGGSSSSISSGCLDARQAEWLNDIQTDIDAGASDAKTQAETIALGDTITLLPILGADGACTVDPVEWIQDCTQYPFTAMRHASLTCRPIANGIELVRPADEALPENVILTIRVIPPTWNGTERMVERNGDDSVARITLYEEETTEDEEGNTETHCVRDDRHIEVRAKYIFEKAVAFVVQTLIVSQPCTP